MTIAHDKLHELVKRLLDLMCPGQFYPLMLSLISAKIDNMTDMEAVTCLKTIHDVV